MLADINRIATCWFTSHYVNWVQIWKVTWQTLWDNDVKNWSNVNITTDVLVVTKKLGSCFLSRNSRKKAQKPKSELKFDQMAVDQFTIKMFFVLFSPDLTYIVHLVHVCMHPRWKSPFTHPSIPSDLLCQTADGSSDPLPKWCEFPWCMIKTEEPQHFSQSGCYSCRDDSSAPLGQSIPNICTQ